MLHFMNMIGRRQLLQIASVPILAPFVQGAGLKIGMIFPPDAKIPTDGLAIYPSGVQLLGEGLNFKGITPDSFDEVIPKIVPASVRLKDRGAQAISLMGTSLTFYKGAAFNRELVESVHKATGLPATSNVKMPSLTA
jgi:Arylmalonate decarboxylase